MKINCYNCNKEFGITPNRLKKNKIHCCSRKCIGIINSKRYDKKLEIKCEECNGLFKVKPSGVKIRKTCSKRCNAIYQGKKFRALGNPRSLKLNEFEKYFYKKCIDLKRGAKNRNLDFNINYQDLIDIYNSQNGLCYYSHIKLNPIFKKRDYDSLSFDRLDSSKGYLKDNIVLCLLCLNYFKSNFNIEDIKKVFDAISLTNKIIIPVDIKLNETALIPSKSNEEDSGSDLIVNNIIDENDYKIIIGTGIKIQPRGNYYAEIHNRSSNHKKGIYLANNVGIIDKTYTGEIILVFLKTPEYKGLEIGDKVAQLILRQQLFIEFTEVSELNETIRGEKGFGSTGK